MADGNGARLGLGDAAALLMGGGDEAPAGVNPFDALLTGSQATGSQATGSQPTWSQAPGAGQPAGPSGGGAAAGGAPPSAEERKRMIQLMYFSMLLVQVSHHNFKAMANDEGAAKCLKHLQKWHAYIKTKMDQHTKGVKEITQAESKQAYESVCKIILRVQGKDTLERLVKHTTALFAQQKKQQRERQAALAAGGGTKRKAEESPPAGQAKKAKPPPPKKTPPGAGSKPPTRGAGAKRKGADGEDDRMGLSKEAIRPGKEEGDILEDAAVDEEAERDAEMTFLTRRKPGPGRPRGRGAAGRRFIDLADNFLSAQRLDSFLLEKCRGQDLRYTANDKTILECMTAAVKFQVLRVLGTAKDMAVHRHGAVVRQQEIEVTSEPKELVAAITRREKAREVAEAQERAKQEAEAAAKAALTDAEKRAQKAREDKLKAPSGSAAAALGMGTDRFSKWSKFSKNKDGDGEGAAASKAAPAAKQAKAAGGLAERMKGVKAAKKKKAAKQPAAAAAPPPPTTVANGRGGVTVTWKDIIAVLEREPLYNRSRWLAALTISGPGKKL